MFMNIKNIALCGAFVLAGAGIAIAQEEPLPGSIEDILHQIEETREFRDEAAAADPQDYSGVDEEYQELLARLTPHERTKFRNAVVRAAEKEIRALEYEMRQAERAQAAAERALRRAERDGVVTDEERAEIEAELERRRQQREAQRERRRERAVEELETTLEVYSTSPGNSKSGVSSSVGPSISGSGSAGTVTLGQ